MKRDSMRWSVLEEKSDDELLQIVRRRLVKAAQHGGVVRRLARLLFPRYYQGGRIQHLDSVYYADLYAVYAVEELINRRSR